MSNVSMINGHIDKHEAEEKNQFVDVGDKIIVWSKTLPTNELNIEAYNMPDFFDGEVVSIRKNSKGWFLKFKMLAEWIEDSFDEECGHCSEVYLKYRYFTYPMSAIGKTVFLTREEALSKLQASCKQVKGE